LKLERRKTTRFDLFESGAIVFKRQVARCVIQNLSLTGAKLHMLSANSDLPPHFLLVRGGTQLLDCQTIWSADRTRGVVFTRPLRELAG
jgi:hypothetical protein